MANGSNTKTTAGANKGKTKTSVAGKKRKSSVSFSKKGSSSQQQQQQPRKRKHADLVTDGKRIWNQLRQKNVSKNERRTLLDELIPMIMTQQNAKEIALQHDGSRLVQAVIQFGNDTERTTLVDLLVQEDKDDDNQVAPLQKKSRRHTNTIVELCQSQYAHFLVLKIFKYCSNASSDKVLSCLRGSMPHLAVHATASRVVEAIWQQCATRTVACALHQELYGPHCSIFHTPTTTDDDATSKTKSNARPTLAANLQAHPTKRDVTLTFVRTLIDKAIAKQQLFGYSFFHAYLLEFLLEQTPSDVRALAATPLADATLHVVASAAGTHVVTRLAAYASAKDRKRMVKALKGYTASALLHANSYLAIIRLVQVTDDTVSSYKNLLAELVAPTATDRLLEIALSPTASKLLRWLLVSDKEKEALKKIFDPAEQAILAPTHPTIADGGGTEIPTSKKDDATRRNELMVHLERPLLQLCIMNTQQLVTSIPGSYVLLGMYRRSPEAIAAALLEVCETPLGNDNTTADDDGSSKTTPTLIWDHPIGHRTLKLLIGSVDASASTTTTALSTALVERYATEHFAPCLASHRGAFVVNALCSVASSPVRAAVLAAVASSTCHNLQGAGYQALAKTIQEGSGKVTTSKTSTKKKKAKQE